MTQEQEVADRPSPGRRIIYWLKEALTGGVASVTIDGVRWVRHEDQKAAQRDYEQRIMSALEPELTGEG